MNPGLNWRIWLGVSSGLITVGGAIPYFWDTIKKTTNPNAASWLMWFLATSVAVTAELSVGFSWATIVIAAATFNALIIFILASRSGNWNFGLFDWLALAAVSLAIGMGLALHSATIAVGLAVVADVLVSLPVTLKTLRQPGSETASAYLWFGAAAVLAVFSLQRLSVLYAVYPAYFILSDFSIGFSSIWSRQKNRLSGRLPLR